MFTIPIAASSAIMAEIVSGVISPGTAIISSPTEHTAVIASSFSSLSVPFTVASIIPASSETGINAPESPPTCDDAITPPFFTASLRSARAAVVP
ncbi:unknown [Ruminococcus sp. CAG:624]|nr:unknown [Ruminococcus sp. CAG:624]